MRVRAGTIADLDVIVAANAAMALETEGLALDLATLRRGVEAALVGGRSAFYRLVEQDGQILGQLMITTEWSDWRAAWVWWIQSVYTWPDWRGRGVYRALYAAVVDEARAAGAGGLRLYVDQRNTAASATYASLGMDGAHYRVFEHMFAEPPLATAPTSPS